MGLPKMKSPSWSTQALPLLDRIPPLPGPRGRRRWRPASMLGDRAYDEERIRRALRARHILPLLAMRNTEHGSELGPMALAAIPRSSRV
jgi:hypothetical protein